MLEIVKTDKAPIAIGPYSQAIIAGDFVFTSGQMPINPQNGEIEVDIVAQTRQSLDNVQNVLVASACSLADVVKTTVFIKNMNDFPVINQIYSECFSEPFPARSCVEVARLPKDVLIEIEAVAVSKHK